MFIFQDLGRFQILDSNKWVVVNRYNKELLIHIREYQTEGEKTYPTKKGVFFSPPILATLRMHLDDIAHAMEGVKSGKTEEFKLHLGKGIFCTISKKFCLVNLRHYFELEGNLTPTKKGICLKMSEWTDLKRILKEVQELDKEIRHANPCFFSGNHFEPGSCQICNPFTLNANLF